MVSFAEILDAFFYVSSSTYGMNSAVLCKDTGEIFYISEMGGIDEVDDKDLDWDKCVDIPHKNDLDLGQGLVFDFVEQHLPDGHQHVREIFRRRGAYGRFKVFLESKGLLQSWYDFENQRQEQVLRQWCEANGIELCD
ncbi:MAG: hypothetical protein JRI41_09325 [Deltaproteobacteria bacterium]|nr:hypothetical protein [Deltaproteobacteria bacterium]